MGSMLILVIRFENDSKRCFFVVTVPVFLRCGADLSILKDLAVFAGLCFWPAPVIGAIL